MEFDEMKEIWDVQNEQSLYLIDEEVLHNRVLKRKNKAARLADRGEKVMIRALLFSTAIIAGSSLYKWKFELFPIALMVVMALVAGVIYAKRRKRLGWQNNFDNTMLGDMDQAVANAESQLKLSSFSKWIYILVAVLSVASMVDELQEWWKGAIIGAFFVVGYFGAKWEHKAIYKAQKQRLVAMRDQIISMEKESTDQ